MGSGLSLSVRKRSWGKEIKLGGGGSTRKSLPSLRQQSQVPSFSKTPPITSPELVLPSGSTPLSPGGQEKVSRATASLRGARRCTAGEVAFL
jgi:hypothetical protein